MLTTEPFPATDLEPGDEFTAASRSTYRVDQIIEAHRAEYGIVLNVTNTNTGRSSTVAFLPGTTVKLTRSTK